MKYSRRERTPEEAKQFAVEVAKAEASFAHLQAELTAIAEKIRANPNADGWVRLCEILDEARLDKRIASSSGASEFLELMQELANDALTTGTVRAAINPLVPELKSEEQAEFGRKSKGKPKPSKAKLPPNIKQQYTELLESVKSKATAKGILCRKYKVTSQGLTKNLKKL